MVMMLSLFTLVIIIVIMVITVAFVITVVPLCRRFYLGVMRRLRFFVMMDDHRSHLAAANRIECDTKYDE